MPRKKPTEVPLKEILSRLKRTSLEQNGPIEKRLLSEDDALCDLDTRVRKLLGLINNPQRKPTNMLFFVMYDIESDKVRTQIAKYLLREGCFRIQRSIFLADKPFEQLEKIRNDLTEVQACYDNQDSILVVPISSDYLQAMKIIGKSIDIDIIMKNRSTLFF